MAKPFKILRNKMTPEARARAKAKTNEMIQEIEALNRFREIRGVTQVKLAQTLQTSQANVSKIENQTDMYLSTLRKYIQGLGGDLEIHVRLPEGDYILDWFQERDDEDENEPLEIGKR